MLLGFKRCVVRVTACAVVAAVVIVALPRPASAIGATIIKACGGRCWFQISRVNVGQLINPAIPPTGQKGMSRRRPAAGYHRALMVNLVPPWEPVRVRVQHINADKSDHLVIHVTSRDGREFQELLIVTVKGSIAGILYANDVKVGPEAPLVAER